MSDFTPKYRLEQPTQEDFYNIDVHNNNMQIIEQQLSMNEEAIKNIDVSSSITSVINERVNTDISKSLNVLISEFINNAKDAITSHITSKINTLPQKSVWTDARGTKLDNLNQSLSTTESNIKSNTSSLINGVKTHIDGKYKVLVASNNKRVTLVGDAEKNYKLNSVIGRWTATKSGVVRVTCTMRGTGGYEKKVIMIQTGDLGSTGKENSLNDARWFTTPVGSTVVSGVRERNYSIICYTSSDSSITEEVAVRVSAGDVLCFIADGNNGGDVPIVKNMYICYDEVSL